MGNNKHANIMDDSSRARDLQVASLKDGAIGRQDFRKSGCAGAKHSIFLLLILCVAVSGFAGIQAEPETITAAAIERKATELESLNPAEARQLIQAMSLSEALSVYDVLLSRARAKGVGPQVFYVAEQIQMIKATEAAHRQLVSLYWVIALTLLLFAAYLTYVLVDQRRIYRKISDKNGVASPVTKTVVPYRGESDGDS